VTLQLLLKKDEAVPRVRGALVRVKGVYFARNEPAWTAPKLEVWVPGIQSLEVVGQLDRDENFQRPATPIDRLSAAAPDKLVRVTGTVVAQDPGKTLTLRDKTGTITFDTVQLEAVGVDEEVEAIGYPTAQGQAWTLQQGLYRRVQTLITRFDQVWQMPESGKNKSHPVRLDFTVHFHDPFWKAAWGRCNGVDNYVSLGEQPFPLRPGQEILIE